ncbi:MAG TPA: metallophosphoesterase [Solirubrobacteraceae bacterium]|nr:metallophosphoesterase [Solirubrobacteraceae bacterium]
MEDRAWRRATTFATAAVILIGLALPSGALAAMVTVTPALPSPGGRVTISAQDFKRGAGGVASLPGARSRRFTVDARGRATVVLHLRRAARRGSRTLRVRAARTRVSTKLTIVARSVASSTLVALSGGQRLLANPNRAQVGGAFRLHMSGFARRSLLTARLGGITLVRGRASARGGLLLQATVPALAPRAHLVRVKSGRRVMSLRFVVLASDPVALPPPPTTPQPPPPPPPAADPVIAAAGDIACSPFDPAFNGGLGNGSGCRQQYVSDLLVGAGLSAVLPLGDIQYDCARLADFAGSFHPSWGRVKSLMRPTPGNHEYKSTNPDLYGVEGCTPDAQGYFSYFGAAAGDPSKGYYSFDIGSWHIVSLNTNLAGPVCPIVSCAAGSAQEQWLRADLAAHRTTCTLAYWHDPLFSSKTASGASRPFWDALYDAGADVVLSGHVHNYERFAPQRPDGTADPVAGIRQFVVGTGGKSLEAHGAPIANSQAQGNSFGVLQMTLQPSSYTWAFRPVSGPPTDSGQTACH